MLRTDFLLHSPSSNSRALSNVVISMRCQRRLTASGTSFAKLVAEVRRERAEAFLAARDVSVAEVS